MPTLLRYLRLTSLAEAVSYLALLVVAMPLKYAADMPLAVSVFGTLHGILFLALIWLLMRTCFETDWPQSRLWILGIAALLPVIPFLLDGRVRAWIQETPDLSSNGN